MKVSMMWPLCLEEVNDGNTAYARAWLRNIAARRGYIQQHTEGSREMQQMRKIMRRFLNLGSE
jgi:hypothetical protein